MGKRYKIVFQNLLQTEDHFKAQMARMGVPASLSEEIIRNAPYTMRRELSLKDARIYAEAVNQAGGRVTIQEYEVAEEDNQKEGPTNITPLKDFMMCPQCGHKQVKAEMCVKCGFSIGKDQR
jgi:hypothetical protein